MIIVRITFAEPMLIPGAQQADMIEPADPRWSGWSFWVDGAHLVIESPTGKISAIPKEWQPELDANGKTAADVRVIVREPLDRCRLVCLDIGEGQHAHGPSDALVEHRAKGAPRVKAVRVPADVPATPEMVRQDEQAAERHEDAAQRAEEPRRKKPREPKRPPWASKDPEPPPSVPVEFTGREDDE